MEISPPFFVFEGLDLSIYDTLESIEENLEGVDVKDGIYQTFDSIGRVIHLKATGVKQGRFFIDIGKTHVDTIESKPTGASRLFGLLQDYLRKIGHVVPHDASLNDLVVTCVSVQHPKKK